MKVPNGLKYLLLAVLTLLTLSGSRLALAQTQRGIEVIATIDYASNIPSVPQHISSTGQVAGALADSDGLGKGFIRTLSGQFGPLLVDPNAAGGGTVAQGVNPSGLVAGYYYSVPDQVVHGFFYTQGAGYTDYIDGFGGTWLYDLNNAGDFCGATCFEEECKTPEGFVSINGAVTYIFVPRSIATYVQGMNNLGDVVGVYHDGGGFEHGFRRKADGSYVAPLDVPGATITNIKDINDAGIMVGSYISAGVTYGFAMTSPAKVITFESPGSAYTDLTGINNKNVMCGTIADGPSSHGVLARLTFQP